MCQFSCYEILINSFHFSRYFILFLILASFICLELESTIIDHSSYPLPSAVLCSQRKELPPLKLYDVASLFDFDEHFIHENLFSQHWFDFTCLTNLMVVGTYYTANVLGFKPINKNLAIQKRKQWKFINICLYEILIDVKIPALKDF